MEIRPQQTVKITRTTPESWFSKEAHRNATCLGKQNPNFTHCYLTYSDTTPKTHALIGDLAIHVNDAGEITRETVGRNTHLFVSVTLALTREAPPTAMTSW